MNIKLPAALFLFGAFLALYNIWAYVSFSSMGGGARLGTLGFYHPTRVYVSLAQGGWLGGVHDPISAVTNITRLIEWQIGAGLILVVTAIVVGLSRGKSRA